MSTESSVCPAWAESLIEQMGKMNAALVGALNNLQDRQDKMEAKFDGLGKEKQVETASAEELDQVMNRLII